MKTEHEIEQMKIEIQENISKVKMKAQAAWDESNETSYWQHCRDCAKLVAQYNIIYEVLR